MFRGVQSMDFHDEKITVQRRVHRSLKLWTFYADLEESTGTFDVRLCVCVCVLNPFPPTFPFLFVPCLINPLWDGAVQATRSIYQHILELRIATPQVVLNYASMLEEKRFFEDAFTVYERGVAMFKWPFVYELWNAYLVKFIKRYVSVLRTNFGCQGCGYSNWGRAIFFYSPFFIYFSSSPSSASLRRQGGQKIERARELFEQCLDGVDPTFATRLYLLYATMEEEHGLARHSMHIYERAAEAAPKTERFDIWQLYIKRAADIFGVTYTRDLYEKAIAALPDAQACTMALQVRVQSYERQRQAGVVCFFFLVGCSLPFFCTCTVRRAGAQAGRNRPRACRVFLCVAVLRPARDRADVLAHVERF